MRPQNLLRSRFQGNQLRRPKIGLSSRRPTLQKLWKFDVRARLGLGKSLVKIDDPNAFPQGRSSVSLFTESLYDLNDTRKSGLFLPLVVRVCFRSLAFHQTLP